MHKEIRVRYTGQITVVLDPSVDKGQRGSIHGFPM